MHFQSTLVALGALAAVAIAQSPLQFNDFFSSVSVGDTQKLSYTATGSGPLTIILRKGPSSDLKDVTTIAKSAPPTSFDWTVGDVPSGKDYALEIKQGDSVNYSNQFEIRGGSGSSSSTGSTGVKGAAASASASFSASISSVVSSVLASANASHPMTQAVGTGVSSGGFSTTMHRNTTLHTATLSAATSTETAVASETAAASTTATETATETGSGAQASKTAGASGLSSSLAFVLSAFVAVVYLN